MSHTDKSSDVKSAAEPLADVLDKNKQIQAEVADAAEELQIVQTVLETNAVTDQKEFTDVKQAVARTGEVSDRLNESVEKLTAVNEALEKQVQERQQQLKK